MKVDSIISMFEHIMKELKSHAPFTILGAVVGVTIIAFFHNLLSDVSYKVFYILHPVHVLLSAVVTASMYELHTRQDTNGKRTRGKRNLWALLLVGYFGSVGIATISDSLIPYLGEVLLRMPNRGIHLGFIEEWWLVNPLALLGVAIAYFRPRTKLPHTGHVLLSTWASMLHIMMAMEGSLPWPVYVAIFLFLFLAVWAPCCVSDIVFPLLFVRGARVRQENTTPSTD